MKGSPLLLIGWICMIVIMRIKSRLDRVTKLPCPAFISI